MHTSPLSFSEYLLWSGFQAHSLPPYLSSVKRLCSRHPEAATFHYLDIIRYLDSLVRDGFPARLRRAHLVAIKKYFDYLLETGQRSDHPCKYLQIKVHEKRNIIHADLFSMPELHSLLNQTECWPCLRTRNQLVISLLIWQAAMPQEIGMLRLQHIDLDRATVYLPGGRILQSRTLPLLPYQLDLLEQYCKRERNGVLENGTLTDRLFVCNKENGLYRSDNIHYLLETLQPLVSKNLTSKQIRDSVISHWLNDKKIPLEQVQLMAGHRSACSTLRYKRENPRTQREMINRLFSH